MTATDQPTPRDTFSPGDSITDAGRGYPWTKNIDGTWWRVGQQEPFTWEQVLAWHQAALDNTDDETTQPFRPVLMVSDQPTPRVGDTITTAEQLDALPVGSVVADADDTAWQVDLHEMWHHTGYEGPQMSDRMAEHYGPLTVLYRPDAPHRAEEEPQIDLTPTPEQRAEQIEFARESQRRRVAVTMTGQGDLAEQGRRLASEREELIAQGVNPAELEVPLHPAGEAVDRRLLAIAGQALDSWDQAAEDTDDVALDAARTMADALRALVRHGYALAAARAGEAVDREALASWTPAEVAASPVGASRVIQSLAARGDAAPSDGETVTEQEQTRNIDGDYSLWRRTVTYGPWREVRDA